MGKAGGRPRYQNEAALMQRAFGPDVLACPTCGGASSTRLVI